MINEDFQDQRDSYFEPLNKPTMAQYREQCEENGEVPCNTVRGHKWVISDENEEVCYCENCGCCEY